MNAKEIELLMLIYKYDKTPAYTYDGSAGIGKRFKTPREHIRDFFGKEFWNHYRKFEESLKTDPLRGKAE